MVILQYYQIYFTLKNAMKKSNQERKQKLLKYISLCVQQTSVLTYKNTTSYKHKGFCIGKWMYIKLLKGLDELKLRSRYCITEHHAQQWSVSCFIHQNCLHCLLLTPTGQTMEMLRPASVTKIKVTFVYQSISAFQSPLGTSIWWNYIRCKRVREMQFFDIPIFPIRKMVDKKLKEVV